ELATEPGGIRISWRAQTDAGFTRFEIERGDDTAGPFAVLGIVDTPVSGTAAYEYLDHGAEVGRTYAYRIAGVQTDGTREVSGPYTTAPPAPPRLALAAPEPNPFNPTTLLRFDVPRSGPVWLRVFDVAGQNVRTLVAGESLPAGSYQRSWDGRDDHG